MAVVLNSFISFPATPVTWSATDKNSLVLLSNGNLTATHDTTTGYANVRSTTSKNSGKWHFEITINTTVSTLRPSVGVGNTNEDLANPIGFSNNSVGYYRNGEVYRGSSLVATLSGYSATDVIAVEVDLDNDLVYFQKSGGSRSSGISISGITGPKFAMQMQEFNTEQSTVNFGATSFTITPTSGFSAWNS